jgi:hypothetical protein
MTGRLTIAKLEALLLRVRARAAEPRSARAIASAAGRAPAVAARPAAELEQEDDQPTLPPPPIAEVSPPAPRPVDIDVVVEDVEAPAAARGSDSPTRSLESKERLVAAPPVPSHLVEEEAARDLEAAPEISQVQEVEVDAEIGEEPPASSRRPVMPEPEERLAEMAFGAEEPSPLRHAPPPESGRLPAAPAEFESGGGVKSEAEQPATELVPEAIRGDLGTSARVVDVIGEAQRFAPSSFAELLDASLSL